MLSEHGRPAHPVSAPLNRRWRNKKALLWWIPCAPLVHPAGVVLPIYALEASGCHSQNRGEQRGTLLIAKKQSCPTPSWPQVKAVRSHRISLAEPEDPWHLLHLLCGNTGSEKGRHLPQVTQQAWVLSMKHLRLEGLES